MRGGPQARLCRMEQLVSYCSLLPSHGCSLPSDVSTFLTRVKQHGFHTDLLLSGLLL